MGALRALRLVEIEDEAPQIEQSIEQLTLFEVSEVEVVDPPALRRINQCEQSLEDVYLALQHKPLQSVARRKAIHSIERMAHRLHDVLDELQRQKAASKKTPQKTPQKTHEPTIHKHPLLQQKRRRR